MKITLIVFNTFSFTDDRNSCMFSYAPFYFICLSIQVQQEHHINQGKKQKQKQNITKQRYINYACPCAHVFFWTIFAWSKESSAGIKCIFYKYYSRRQRIIVYCIT